MNAHDQASKLIGTWKSDPNDAAGARSYGNVTLKFEADGTLLYIAQEADNQQVIRLTFRVEADYIFTDQPSHPHPEKTKYELMADGKLVLSFGGEESRYIRVA